MKLHIFCLRDSKTDQYGTPMFLTNEGHAIRSVSDECNRAEEQNMLYRHPDDFTLFQLGSYDTDSGIIEATAPRSIINLSQLKK